MGEGDWGRIRRGRKEGEGKGRKRESSREARGKRRARGGGRKKGDEGDIHQLEHNY